MKHFLIRYQEPKTGRSMLSEWAADTEEEAVRTFAQSRGHTAFNDFNTRLEIREIEYPTNADGSLKYPAGYVVYDVKPQYDLVPQFIPRKPNV
jgi:hypothetical protein